MLVIVSRSLDVVDCGLMYVGDIKRDDGSSCISVSQEQVGRGDDSFQPPGSAREM